MGGKRKEKVAVGMRQDEVRGKKKGESEREEKKRIQRGHVKEAEKGSRI